MAFPGELMAVAYVHGPLITSSCSGLLRFFFTVWSECLQNISGAILVPALRAFFRVYQGQAIFSAVYRTPPRTIGISMGSTRTMGMLAVLALC